MPLKIMQGDEGGTSVGDPEEGVAAILTTKGDLMGRSATIPSRVAVGNDGQFVMALASQGLGLTYGLPGVPTILVVPPDSKNASHYVQVANKVYTPNGTADEVELQAAFDALNSGTGTIVVADGTLNLASGAIFDLANSKGFHLLFGGTVLKPAAGVTALEIQNASAWFYPCAIRGLAIDGDSGANTVGLKLTQSNYVHLEDATFRELAKGMTFDLAAGGKQCEGFTGKNICFINNDINIEMPAGASNNSVMQFVLDDCIFILYDGQVGISQGQYAQMMRSRLNNVGFWGMSGAVSCIELDSTIEGSLWIVHFEKHLATTMTCITLGSNYIDTDYAKVAMTTTGVVTRISNGSSKNTINFGSAVCITNHAESVNLDLSGSATDVPVYHAAQNVVITKATLLYTEASSADAGVNLRIGYEGDNNYYYEVASEASKAQWYEKDITGDLASIVLNVGNTLTFGTAGGKTGTGEVRLVLEISPREYGLG